MPFECNIQGQCEEREDGQFMTLEACQEDCRGVPVGDLNYLIYQYNPEQAAFDLAPHEQREVLKRLAGVDIADPVKVSELLLSLGGGADPLMARHVELWQFLLFNGRLTTETLALAGTIPAIQELQHRPQEVTDVILRTLFLTAVTNSQTDSLSYLLTIMTLPDFRGYFNSSYHLVRQRVEIPLIDQWVLARPAILVDAIPYYYRREDLPLLLAAWVQSQADPAGDAFDIEGTILHFTAQVPDIQLIFDFVDATGALPFFEEVLARGDVDDITELLESLDYQQGDLVHMEQNLLVYNYDNQELSLVST